MKLIMRCVTMHSFGEDEDGRQCVGHCPACHQAVYANQDPVWTCPADLNRNNPHRAGRDIPEVLQQREGCYSNCWDDFGRSCSHEHMPLHGKCYGSRTLTY